MTLTLPRAGTNPGRAARAPQIPRDETGEAVAQFGQAMNALGQDMLDRQLKRATVDMTRDINDLRLEIEAIGDPDEADQRWEAGVQEIRQGYVGNEAGQEAALDRQNHEPFNLAFDQLANRVAASVGARNLGLRQAQRQSIYTEYAHEAGRMAPSADPDTRAAMIAQGDEHIAGLLETGVIDANQAQKMQQGLRGDISNARAIGLLADDPEAFLAEAGEGGFPGLEGDTLKRYELSAKSAIAKREEQAAKQAEKRAKARQKEIGDRLGEMRDIMGAGRIAVDEAFLNSSEVKKHPDYAQTMAAYSLREEKHELATMTPAQIDALIAGEKSKKVAHEWQTERLEVLQDWRDKHAEGYRTDSIAWARQNQVPEPGLSPLPEFDANDPQSFGEALISRAEAVADMTEDGYPMQGRLLDEGERAQIRAAADIDNAPEDRAALAVTLRRALPPEALGDIAEDPVFAHVGGLIDRTGAQALGAEVLRGQQVMAEKNIVMPPARDRAEPVFEALGAYFADIEGGEKLQSNITAAADALYSARVRRTDPAGDLDEDIYRQALHEVMGGTGAYDSRNATGGLQDVRGQMTPLPRGVGGRDVDGVLEQISVDMRGVRSPKYPEAVQYNRQDARQKFNLTSRPLTRLTSDEARARANDAWQSAAVNGALPGINGEPLEADTLDSLKIKAVGPDAYRLIDDEGTVVPDLETGEPYEFSLVKLMEVYAP